MKLISLTYSIQIDDDSKHVAHVMMIFIHKKVPLSRRHLQEHPVKGQWPKHHKDQGSPRQQRRYKFVLSL